MSETTLAEIEALYRAADEWFAGSTQEQRRIATERLIASQAMIDAAEASLRLERQSPSHYRRRRPRR